MTAVDSKPDTKLEILRKYGTGMDLHQIGLTLEVEHHQVVAVVEGTGYNRANAAEQVRQHEARRRQAPVAPARPAQAPKPAPKPVVAAPVVPPAAPKVAPVLAAPAPAPAQRREGLEELLTRAASAPRLQTRVIRIRTMIDDLRRDLATVEKALEAKQRVDELTAQLAEATAALKKLSQPAAAASAATDHDGVDSQAVRDWAARNNVPCKKSGRLPGAVLQQYLTAKGADRG